ncbi:MAG: glycerol-3-phosphate 1-O-acyltransferase PlsY [Lachnospiraceae bacterium]|nr:glycerol-3-phosphate 1-O-acyltransferase PlsY [Lachnospiraceae bacterium]
MERIICLLIGYACGLIQTGFIVGKIKGIDIRQYGSKNAGTTNVLRTMGAKYGIIVFIGDALKCILAVLICKLIFQASCADYIKLLQLYAAAGTILGHNYPFYMKFRGGKGIASTAGFVISMGPVFVLFGVITFFTTYFLTNYVSLGSILVYVVLGIELVLFGETGIGTFFFGENGYFGFPAESARMYLNEFYLVFAFLFILALLRHKENIKRLIRHNERKTYIFGKPEIDLDAAEKEKQIESDVSETEEQ